MLYVIILMVKKATNCVVKSVDADGDEEERRAAAAAAAAARLIDNQHSSLLYTRSIQRLHVTASNIVCMYD